MASKAHSLRVKLNNGLLTNENEEKDTEFHQMILRLVSYLLFHLKGGGSRFRGLAHVPDSSARVPSLARVPGVAHSWYRIKFSRLRYQVSKTGNCCIFPVSAAAAEVTNCPHKRMTLAVAGCCCFQKIAPSSVDKRHLENAQIEMGIRKFFISKALQTTKSDFCLFDQMPPTLKKLRNSRHSCRSFMFLYSETLLENLFGTLFLVTSALDGQSISRLLLHSTQKKTKIQFVHKFFLLRTKINVLLRC